MVESEVNGQRPVAAGPAPAAQARASNSRLTRSSWRTWPQRKLRRKVPRVDGALTVPPRVQAVPPVRNTSASSMQSPPASAEATSVIILSPVFARPGGIAQVEALPDEFGQAEMPGQGGGKEQPGIGHQAAVVEGDTDAVGVVAWVASIGVLLVLGSVCCFKTIIPDSKEHPLASSEGFPHAFVRWIRAKRRLSEWPDIRLDMESLRTWYRFEMERQVQPDAEVNGFLAYLNERQVPWGIVTNGSPSQHGKCRAAGLDKLAGFIIVSEEAGYRKPDARIFRDALEATGLAAPEQVMFVGDNPLADIDGAKRFGMKAAWVRRDRPYPPDLIPPDHVIDLVIEVRDIVGLAK